MLQLSETAEAEVHSIYRRLGVGIRVKARVRDRV